MVENVCVIFFFQMLYGTFESIKINKVVKGALSKCKASRFKFGICYRSKSPVLIGLPFSLGTTAAKLT